MLIYGYSDPFHGPIGVRSCFEASSSTGAVRFDMKLHEVLKKKKKETSLKKLHQTDFCVK